MHRRFALLLILIATPARAEVSLGGFIETQNYIGLMEGEYFNFRNMNVLGLKVDATLMDSALAGKAELQVRNINVNRVTDLESMGQRWEVQPVDLLIKEAYIEWRGFLWRGLDLMVGQQRIAWGTGDQINPTDNINPYNFENPLDFSSKLGVPAVKLTAYIADLVTITAFAVPIFTPALIPTEFLDLEVMVPSSRLIPPGFEAFAGDVDLSQVDVRVDSPDLSLDNTQAGARVAWSMFDFTFSVSYYHGRDSLPQLSGDVQMDMDISQISLTNLTSLGAEGMIVHLVYPRLDVLGFDFAGSLWDLGFWGEVAVFFPQSLELDFPDLRELNDLLHLAPHVAPTVLQGESPYPKLVVGLDYTFPGGLYVNLQYLYGFFAERRLEDLNHYLFCTLRYSLLNDKLSLEARGGGEIHDTRTGGGLVGGEVAYRPTDASAVTLGALAIMGTDGSTLGGFERMDQVYLRFRMDF